MITINDIEKFKETKQFITLRAIQKGEIETPFLRKFASDLNDSDISI